MADLSGTGTENHLAVAGDGEDEASLVDLLAVALPEAVVAAHEVAEGTRAGLQGEAADGQVDEGREDGEGGGLLSQLLVVAQLVDEIEALALVGRLSRSRAPQGVVDLDEAGLHCLVGDDLDGLEAIDGLDGQCDVAHNAMYFWLIKM